MITLHKHHITAHITDRYSTAVYGFDFENLNGYATELKFEITIDPDAFIAKFEADIDGQLFVGQTKEKETAAKEYKEAKKKKENAILISQPHKNIPNVFQIKTNIDSKSKISLNITIQQYLQKKFNFNNLTIQILRNFKKYNIKTNYEYIGFTLDISDQCGIYDVSIPSTSSTDNDDFFSFLQTPTESAAEVIIDQQTMDKMNQNCKINGKIDAHKSSINELTLKYKIKGEAQDSYILFDTKSCTFCHIISNILGDNALNEKVNESNIIIPRRVLFVIDKSGSMSGGKWRRTTTATVTALKQLRNGYDRFNVLLFNHGVDILFDGMVMTDKIQMDKAINYMKSQQAGGGTDIDKPLKKSIKMIKKDIELTLSTEGYNYFINQILFITDGEVSNTKQILVNVNKINHLNGIDKYSKKISIFSFGVGQDGNDSGWVQDLNHSFLKSLAVNNNGFYKRIKNTNIDTKLNEYFSILSKPIATNIAIEYNNKYIGDLTNTYFNTLYSGNDIIIAGKIGNIKNMKKCNLSATITAITGKQSSSNNNFNIDLIVKPLDISKKITVNIDMNGIENNNTERIWAYLKLKQLAKQKVVFNDMIEMDDDEEKQQSSLALSLAMKYKFVTPWTSMIVVKKKDNKQFDKNRNDEEKDEKEEKITKKQPPKSGKQSVHRRKKGKAVSFWSRDKESEDESESDEDYIKKKKYSVKKYKKRCYSSDEESESDDDTIKSAISAARDTLSSVPLSVNDMDLLGLSQSSNANMFCNNNNNNANTDLLGDLLGMTMKKTEASSKKAAVLPPFEAYNKNGILITFKFVSASSSSGSNSICRVIAVFMNNNCGDITDFEFKIAVPKYIKLQIKAANGTKLLGLNQNSIQQKFQLNNTMINKPFIMRIQITFKINGKEYKERAQIQLPDNCCC